MNPDGFYPEPDYWHDPQVYWVTQDKRRIKIVEMYDDHLINCINMLMRREYVNYILLDPLLNEFKQRQLNECKLIRPLKPDWREGF